MWVVHILVAGFIALFGQFFLVGSGFVSVHDGALATLLFVVALALLRLSERKPSSKPPSPCSPEEQRGSK
jgi:hypothetical protein